MTELSQHVTCQRCGTSQPRRSPFVHGGAVEVGPGYWICSDGRECSLRYKRKRRQGTL